MNPLTKAKPAIVKVAAACFAGAIAAAMDPAAMSVIIARGKKENNGYHAGNFLNISKITGLKIQERSSMLELILIPDGEGKLEDLQDKEVIYLEGIPIRILGLKHGMASGKASAALVFELPDGRYVLAQTSLALLATAIDGLKAKYPGQY